MSHRDATVLEYAWLLVRVRLLFYLFSQKNCEEDPADYSWTGLNDVGLLPETSASILRA